MTIAGGRPSGVKRGNPLWADRTAGSNLNDWAQADLGSEVETSKFQRLMGNHGSASAPAASNRFRVQASALWPLEFIELGALRAAC